MGMGSKLTETVERIVKAAGRREEWNGVLARGGHFHLRIENGSLMPLVIESWRLPRKPGERVISVAHYFEQNGDQVPDPDVEILGDGLPMNITTQFRYTRVGWWDEAGELQGSPSKRCELQGFLNLWAGNIKAQGFIEAAGRLAVGEGC